MTTFSFRKTAHRCIVCVTRSNWVKMWFSCFVVLPGSAEAQVSLNGIVKRLLINYFIANISAKNISKSIHVCQSYSKPNVGRFLIHGVVIRGRAYALTCSARRWVYGSKDDWALLFVLSSSTVIAQISVILQFNVLYRSSEFKGNLCIQVTCNSVY